LQAQAQLLASAGLPADLYAALAGRGLVQATHWLSALAAQAVRYCPTAQVAALHWLHWLALL
jgi:hypothetical protein